MVVGAETTVSRGDMETGHGRDVPRQRSIGIGRYRYDHGLEVTVKMKITRLPNMHLYHVSITQINGKYHLDVV
jgi:hypothetical protein